jgi:hypothetical protein
VSSGEELVNPRKQFSEVFSAVALNSTTKCGGEKEFYEAAPNAVVCLRVEPNAELGAKRGFLELKGKCFKGGNHYKSMAQGSSDCFFPEVECTSSEPPPDVREVRVNRGLYDYTYGFRDNGMSTPGEVKSDCTCKALMTPMRLTNSCTAPRRPLDVRGVRVPKINGEMRKFQMQPSSGHLGTTLGIVDRRGQYEERKCIPGVRYGDFNLIVEKVKRPRGTDWYLLGGTLCGVQLIVDSKVLTEVHRLVEPLFNVTMGSGHCFKVRPFGFNTNVPEDGIVYYNDNDPFWGRKYKHSCSIDFDVHSKSYKQLKDVLSCNFTCIGFPPSLPEGLNKVFVEHYLGTVEYQTSLPRDDKALSDSFEDIVNTIIYSYD